MSPKALDPGAEAAAASEGSTKWRVTEDWRGPLERNEGAHAGRSSTTKSLDSASVYSRTV